MKKICIMAVALGLAVSTSFGQRLSAGTRELSVNGQWDRDSVMGELTIGQFLVDGMIVGVGVMGMYQDYGSDVDAKSIGGTVFTQYHFDMGAPLVPFVGIAGGVMYNKIETANASASETSWIGEGQLGVKTFVADNVAISLYGFYDVSDKDIFTDKDELDKKDFGMRIGMNTYF